MQLLIYAWCAPVLVAGTGTEGDRRGFQAKPWRWGHAHRLERQILSGACIHLKLDISRAYTVYKCVCIHIFCTFLYVHIFVHIHDAFMLVNGDRFVCIFLRVSCCMTKVHIRFCDNVDSYTNKSIFCFYIIPTHATHITLNQHAWHRLCPTPSGASGRKSSTRKSYLSRSSTWLQCLATSKSLKGFRKKPARGLTTSTILSRLNSRNSPFFCVYDRVFDTRVLRLILRKIIKICEVECHPSVNNPTSHTFACLLI